MNKKSLVLLLVILTGLILMMGMPFAPPNMGIIKAKKLQTEDNSASLKAALTAYHDIYGKLPELGAQADEIKTDGEAGSLLLTILLGKESQSPEMQNPRAIEFLAVKGNKNKTKGGLVYNNGGPGSIPEGFYDAWGEPFYVYFRKPGSTKLGFSYQGKEVTLDEPVAILSKSMDGKVGTRDDIKTW